MDQPTHSKFGRIRDKAEAQMSEDHDHVTVWLHDQPMRLAVWGGMGHWPVPLGYQPSGIERHPADSLLFGACPDGTIVNGFKHLIQK